MSIRNKDLIDIINSCKYYENEIERESYINPWRNSTKNEFSGNKRCIRLQRKRYLNDPIVREDPTDIVYSYKINQPRYQIGKLSTNIKELFEENRTQNDIVFLIISFLVIMVGGFMIFSNEL